MENILYPKIISAIKNNDLDSEEKTYLLDYIKILSPKNLAQVYKNMLSSENSRDYLLILIYGTKIKKYLENIAHLNADTKKEMISLALTLQGEKIKTLYTEIISNNIEQEDLAKILDSIKKETNEVLSVTNSKLSEFIIEKSEEKDKAAIEKLRSSMSQC